MDARLTLWGAGQLLNSFFSRSEQPPANFYLALIKDVAPTPFVSGAELDEPTAAEYERVIIPNEPNIWTNAGAIQVTVCETALAFIPAQEDWGTIRYWALCNAVADGFVYLIGKFENPEVIETGDTAYIPEGTLSVTVGPFFSAEGN